MAHKGLGWGFPAPASTSAPAAAQEDQVFTYVSSVSMDSPRAAPPWMDSMAVE